MSGHGVNSLRQSINAKRGCSYTLYPTPYTLILAFLLTLAPLAHSAWNGTADTAWYTEHKTETAFTIDTPKKLAGLAKLVNGTEGNGTYNMEGKTITLGADIELNNTADWENWANTAPANQWTPIGTDGKPFSGTFDGAGYKISGLYINNFSGDNQGLFGYTSNAALIKNVGVVEGYVSGNANIGGLVGLNYSTISNSYTAVNVSGGGEVGGLVGSNQGTISNSYAEGDVSGYEDIGGLAGHNYGTISNSYAIGDVEGFSNDIGGLVGRNRHENARISNSYATGDVEGPSNTGGLVGQNDGGTIEYSYASGNARGTGEGENVGGLVGYNYGTITSSDSKTIDQMKQKATFVGWDFTDTWFIDQGNDYPKLLWSLFESGSGTEDSPYIITTKKQLEYLAILTNAGHSFQDEYISLGNDIELNATTNWEDWGIDGSGLNQWTPIGIGDNSFNGTFNGAGHKISGLYVINFAEDYQGLFGYIGSEAVIKNVGVVAGYVLGKYTGFLAGYNGGTINNSYASGNVSEDFGSNIGGLVGYNNPTGTISNSYATGNVNGSGDYVGGLVGHNYGTISSSYASGNVSGSNYIGGLVGKNDSDGSVSNSYYKNDTDGSDEGKGIPKTTAQMKQQATFAGWNFHDIWLINEGEDYPKLLGFIPDFDESGSAAPSNLPYTGDSIKPAITIGELTEDTDFKVRYFNNVNAGDAWAVAWGIGGYEGKVKVIDFTIEKADVFPDVTFPDDVTEDREIPYNGEVPDIGYTGFVGDGTPIFRYYSDNNNEVGTELGTAPINAGTYWVQITIAATANCNQGTSEAVKYEITKATLTITANNEMITYGESVPEFTISYNGFVNDETEAELSAVPTASTTAGNGSDADIYDITPSGGIAANYEFSYVNGTLTIAQKELTVTGAQAQSKEYDDTIAATIIGAVLEGVVGGDDVYLEKADAGIFASVDVGEGISVSTAMTLGGAKAGNYTLIQPVGLQADIRKKAVSVPTAIGNLIYSGLEQSGVNVEADSVNFVSGDASATDANSYSAEYALLSTNYKWSDGNTENKTIQWSIAKKALTATADDKTITYGDEIPSLTISYNGFVNGETEADLITAPTAGTNTGDAGNYDITLSGGSSGNYEITLENGTLAVTPKQLIVAGAQVQNKEYDGTAAAAIIGAILGGVVGEDEVYLENADIGTFASTEVGEGIAVITDMALGGAKAGNYTLIQPSGLTADITAPVPIIANGTHSGNFDLQVQNGILWIFTPLSNARNDVKVQIYSLNGAKVRSFSFASGVYSVSLGDLPKGMYVVRAQINGSQRSDIVKKVMVK